MLMSRRNVEMIWKDWSYKMATIAFAVFRSGNGHRTGICLVKRPQKRWTRPTPSIHGDPGLAVSP